MFEKPCLLISVVIIVSCNLNANDLNKKNEIGLSFSNLDPIGICYNRYLSRNKYNLILKSGFLFWKEKYPKRSILTFSLKPSAEVPLLKKNKILLSISTGNLLAFEKDIYNNDVTPSDGSLADNDSAYVGRIDNAVEYQFGKIYHSIHMSPCLSIRFSYNIVHCIRLSFAAGIKTQCRWILKQEPLILDRFSWTEKVALGLLSGIYYYF